MFKLQFSNVIITFTDIDMRKINNIITKLIEKVGLDKITHLFAGATIALSVTLILCLVCSIFNVIPYSILETDASVICGVVKEICDSEFNKEYFLAIICFVEVYLLQYQYF